MESLYVHIPRVASVGYIHTRQSFASSSKGLTAK